MLINGKVWVQEEQSKRCPVSVHATCTFILPLLLSSLCCRFLISPRGKCDRREREELVTHVQMELTVKSYPVRRTV
jgi:hypothetical protein